MNAKEPTHGIDGAQPSVNADQTTRAVRSARFARTRRRCSDRADLAGAFRATRFRLRELHAHGGLGEVYVADDLELGRPVALKRIRDGRELRAEDEIRFRREAEITGRLEHPGIVPIYGLGSDSENRPFYAMRFIEGQTLASAIDAFHNAEHDRPRSRRTHAGAAATCSLDSWRRAKRSPSPILAASSTATSSPPTSCSAISAKRSSSIGAWPSRPTHRRIRRRTANRRQIPK